jgi:hypothetical protein
MSKQNHEKSIKKLVALIGVSSASVFLSVPALALINFTSSSFDGSLKNRTLNAESSEGSRQLLAQATSGTSGTEQVQRALVELVRVKRVLVELERVKQALMVRVLVKPEQVKLMLVKPALVEPEQVKPDWSNGADGTGAGQTGTGQTDAGQTGVGGTGAGGAGTGQTGTGGAGAGQTGAGQTGTGQTGTGQTGTGQTGTGQMGTGGTGTGGAGTGQMGTGGTGTGGAGTGQMGTGGTGTGQTGSFVELMRAGYAATQQRDYTTALTYFQQALQLRPNNPYARRAVSNVQSYMQRDAQRGTTTTPTNQSGR